MDKECADYYNCYSGSGCGEASTYDPGLNTDHLGLDGVAALIVDAINHRKR